MCLSSCSYSWVSPCRLWRQGAAFTFTAQRKSDFFFFFKGHPTSRMYDIANSLEADPDPILRVHMCLTLETWSLKCTDTENELYSEAEDICSSKRISSHKHYSRKRLNFLYSVNLSLTIPVDLCKMILQWLPQSNPVWFLFPNSQKLYKCFCLIYRSLNTLKYFFSVLNF